MCNKFMILGGWEVRIGKNCDRGLENAAFSNYRSFSYCRKLAFKWVCLRNFAIESYRGPEGSHMQIKNVAAN